MSPRSLGFVLSGFALLAGLLRLLQLRVPVFKIPFLAGDIAGWILTGFILSAGSWLIWRWQNEWNFSPLTLKQLKRFRSIKRGYISFLLLLGLTGLAMLDNLLVGKQALVVKYQGQYYFPFIGDKHSGETFGLDYESEANYRELKTLFETENQGNWVVLPPVPYDATLDTPQNIVTLEERNGELFEPGKKEPFSGRAYSVFEDTPSKKRQEFLIRHGLRSGEMRGWNLEGEQVEKGVYDQGRLIDHTIYDASANALVSSDSASAAELHTIIYPPAPPSWRNQHYLGTNSLGSDVLAILFGGWQQAIMAAVIFVTIVFTTGILIGGTLGYFGGVYDLLGQRLIEIWANLPFLFIVMIVSSIISPTLVILVGILALFGWMGTTTYLRTATYREKSRDYVAAAKLQGASTGRIIFRHVLPNVIAILVTLAPFEVAGVITALAALDFLGFGLPPDQPSWGRLLQEGTENFNYPWIVSSAFFAMVTVLVLVTFVGEAVREAFDPKKFTVYE